MLMAMRITTLTSYVLSTMIGLGGFPSSGAGEVTASTLIDGYVAIKGQTVLLFPNPESLAKFSLRTCKNLGSSAHDFKRLKRHEGEHVYVKAVNIHNPYPKFLGLITYNLRLGGRIVQQWCYDDDIYWFKSFVVNPPGGVAASAASKPPPQTPN